MGLKIKELNFAYGKHPVLDNISLEISGGEVVALLGPNGSGKTTLLESLAGILTPEAEKLQLAGESLQALERAERARQVALVPQKERRPFETTVFDFVLDGRRPLSGWRPSAGDREKTARTLGELQLTDLAGRLYHELSGGQQQKVLLARALVQKPDLLLLDEPTANLDLKHQMEVMETVRARSGKDRIVLAAMHELTLAGRYCDKFILLNNGAVHSVGGPEVITPDSVAAVYGVEAEVTEQPDGGPRVEPTRPL